MVKAYHVCSGYFGSVLRIGSCLKCEICNCFGSDVLIIDKTARWFLMVYKHRGTPVTKYTDIRMLYGTCIRPGCNLVRVDLNV